MGRDRGDRANICGGRLVACGPVLYDRVLLGSVAFSTTGGNRMVSHTAVAYSKYFLSVTFEAVTMAFAIIVSNAFINAGLPEFTGDYSDWAETLIFLFPVPMIFFGWHG